MNIDIDPMTGIASLKIVDYGYPEDIESATALDEKKSGQYRALAARANYLGLDRVDIAYAAKECCRHMVTPRDIDWTALRRRGRYLTKRPRGT